MRSSLVQLMNSVLLRPVPRSGMIHCGIPKEKIYFSTAEIVARAVVLRTGYAIKNRENASTIRRQ